MMGASHAATGSVAREGGARLSLSDPVTNTAIALGSEEGLSATVGGVPSIGAATPRAPGGG